MGKADDQMGRGKAVERDPGASQEAGGQVLEAAGKDKQTAPHLGQRDKCGVKK